VTEGQKIGIPPIIERGFEKNIAQALETGADYYITKPFEPAKLLADAMWYCDTFRTAQQARRLPVTAGDLQLSRAPATVQGWQSHTPDSELSLRMPLE
jgi:DNA-binding response OmpR family regulator